MIIAVDHGNSAIKTVHHSFPSGLTESVTPPPMADELIRINSRYYAPSGQRIPYMRDKTKDDRFFILTLFAIMKELEEADAHPAQKRRIELAVGLPPDHYSIQKDDFERYFRRTVRFHYNDTLMELDIGRVLVYPQAYAAAACRIAEIKRHSRAYVVDIGGYTTDVIMFRSGRFDKDYYHSFDMGVIGMTNRIAHLVNTKYDIPIEEDHVCDVLSGRETVLPSEVRMMIRDAALSYTKRILDTLRENAVNLRAAPALFVGGGSLLLKSELESSGMMSDIIIETDTRANAKGFHLLAEAQLQKDAR